RRTHESHNSYSSRARSALCGRSLRADSAAAGLGHGRQAHGRPRDVVGSDRFAEGAGANDPPGGAREGEGELRAGARLWRQARLATDEGTAPADPAGDAAEAGAGAFGNTVEEVPDHRRGNARARHAPSPGGW